MNIKLKQLDIVLEQVKEAVAAHVPIVYIPTDQMEIVNELLYNKDNMSAIIPRVRYDNDRGEHILVNENYITDENGSVISITDNIQSKSTFKTDKNNPQIYVKYVTTWEQIISDIHFYVKTYYGIPFGNYTSPNETNNAFRSLYIVVTPKEEVVPPLIAPYVQTVRIPALADDEIISLIKQHLCQENIPFDILPDYVLSQMIVSFRGFGRTRIQQMLRLMVAQQSIDFDRADAASILNVIRSSKKQMLDNCPGLAWEKSNVSGVAGLDSITNWLQKRKDIFLDPERALQQHIDIPKGILISGIPGSGKSLMAKTTASFFDMPLISLDMGALLGQYMGQSEHNMIHALQMAEQMAPCVLWIDEIEKAFSGSSKGSSSSDGGVGRRMFGKFLTWMQEKTAACFVFATSNDISNLPPELFRSERFDRKFYTFMPTAQECAQIFAANIKAQNNKYKKELQEMPQHIRVFQATHLFSLDLQEPTFWLKILNDCCSYGSTSYGLKREEQNERKNSESNNKSVRYVWDSSSKPKHKLLTGADISSLIREAKFRVHATPITSNIPTVIYETTRMKEAVCDLLKSQEFKPYGETNLKDIVKCFLKLQENEFSPASGHCIIDFNKYDEDKMLYMYDPADHPVWENKYDEVLFNTIVGAINMYAREINAKKIF